MPDPCRPRSWPLIAAVALLLAFTAAACRAEAPPARSPLDDRGPQPTLAPGVATFPPPFLPPAATAPAATGSPGPGSDEEAVVGAAIAALAERIGLGATRFTLDRVEAVSWPDGCLGVAVPGLLCTQMVTPGYRVVLRFESGSRHEVRSGRAGQFAWAPQATLHAAVEQPGGILVLVDGGGRARQALIGAGTLMVDLTAGVLKAGDRVVLGYDDLLDGSPLRVAWLARDGAPP